MPPNVEFDAALASYATSKRERQTLILCSPGTHIVYPDYTLLVPELHNMSPIINQISSVSKYTLVNIV